MRRFTLTLAALAAVMLVPLAALGDDTQIAQEVARRLEQQKQTGQLENFSLNLEVVEGSVELTGQVSSQEQQTLVLEVARRVPGVVQVVNGIEVAGPARRPAAGNPELDSILRPNSMLATLEQQADTGARRVHAEQASMPQMTAPPVAIQQGPYPVQIAQQQRPQPMQAAPQQMQAAPARPLHPSQQPQYQQYQQQQPQYLADAYGAQGQGQGAPPQYMSQGGGPVPMGTAPVPAYMPAGGAGVAAARYDNPQLPAHAWPAYAASPNYAAVTYPKQYSPSAWPYIGPFYPYPQVPLGWRKVTLEWDDGWWFLDFEDH